MYTHTYMHAYVRTFVRTYVRTYIHTYIHTYNHATQHMHNSFVVIYKAMLQHPFYLAPSTLRACLELVRMKIDIAGADGSPAKSVLRRL